jgi:hypothetical protein
MLLSYCSVHAVFLLYVALPSHACIRCIPHTDRVSDVRQIEIPTVESVVLDPNPLEVETVIAKLKRYKSPDSVQFLAELIQAGGEILHSKTYKLINSIWNKEKLSDQ